MPVRVTTLTAAPELRPYSAEKFAVLIATSVDGEQRGVRAAAVDRGVDAEPGHDVERVRVEVGSAGDEGGELQVVAAVQGQALDLLAVDRPGDLAGDRVDRLALDRDLDRLVEAADLELEVRADAAVGHEHEARAETLLEALHLGAHAVRAERQVREDVGAGGVGGGAAGVVRLDLGDRHRGARKQPALGVGDRAGDAAGRGLRENRGAQHGECRQGEQGADGSTHESSLNIRFRSPLAPTLSGARGLPRALGRSGKPFGRMSGLDRRAILGVKSL